MFEFFLYQLFNIQCNLFVFESFFNRWSVYVAGITDINTKIIQIFGVNQIKIRIKFFTFSQKEFYIR